MLRVQSTLRAFFLMGVLAGLAQAAPIEWNGSSGTSWGTGSNWDGGIIPNAADAEARFFGKATGNVDIGGGMYTVDALNFSAGPYSLIDSGAGSLSLNKIIQSGGSNAIGLKLSSPSLNASISGGSLNVTNAGNAISAGTWTISGGGTLRAEAIGTTSALGSANVTLSGGTLDLAGVSTTVPNALLGSIFFSTTTPAPWGPHPTNVMPGDVTPMNLDGATYTNAFPRVFTGSAAGTILKMAENPSLNVVVTGSTQNWTAWTGKFDGNTDQFITAFSGQFVPTTTGSYNFHWNNDDAGLMYLDLNRNGVFEASERIAAYGWNMNGNVTLTGGTPYNMIYMAREYGGGQSVWWAFTPPVGSEQIVNPGASVGGAWQYVGPALTATLGNSLTVTANSTASVSTVTKVTLDSLSIPGASQLTKIGPGSLIFSQAVGTNSLAAGSSLKVNEGTLGMVAKDAVTNPLGSADVILNGGTLELKGATTVTAANALRQVVYNIGPNDNYMNINQNNGLMALTPYTSAIRTGQLNYSSEAVFNITAAQAEAGKPAFTASDGYMNLFRGYLNVPVAGTYTFRIGGQDDRSMIWLDLNQDGVFQSSNNLLGGNNNEQIRWQDNSTYTVSLNPGKYMIAIGHGEYSGGASITAYVKSPSMASEALINPSDAAQAGMWSVEDLSTVNVSATNFAVTANSGLRTLTDNVATVGTVTLSNGATLTTSGGKATIAQIAFSGPAGRTAGLEVNNTVSSPLLTDGGVATSFVKSGLGTLTLTGVSAIPGTSVEVKAGTLSAVAPAVNANPLNNAGTLILSGGTYEAVGATTSVNNALRHTGYSPESPDAGMNLNNNNGVLITPAYGSRLMTRDVIAHYTDTDFMSTGVVGTNDNFMNMWLGYFTAPTTGTYGFRIGGYDERGAIWIDLNQDGVFKSTTGALATNNGELVRYQDTSNYTVTLTAGQTYKIAYLHGEYGGGSNINGGLITLPGGTEMPVNPGDPAQAGLWKTDAVGPVDMSATNVAVAAGTTTSVLRATSDYAMKFGSLTLGAGATVTTAGAKTQFTGTTFTSASTFLAGIDGADLGNLKTSGGQSNIGAASAIGNTPNLTTIANLILGGSIISPIVTAATYNDQGIPYSTMRIFNGATLALDNSTPGNVVAGNTTFRVEAYSSMLRAAPTAAATPPLGAGTPKVLLAGGTLSVQGVPTGGDIPNALAQYGYHSEIERTVNLDGTNGIVTQDGVLARVAYNRVQFTNGPGNIGLSFTNNFPTTPYNDYDFLKTGAVGQADNFANVFLGYLNVPAAGGTYQFRIGSQDDRAGIWIDLNNNGKFESTTGGLERSATANNGELIAWSGGVAVAGNGADNGTKTITFPATGTPTKYLFAVTQAEYNTASNVTAYVKSPSMTGQALIAPSDPAQAGMWSIGRLGDINASNVAVTVSHGLTTGTATTSTISALTDGTARFGTLTFGGWGISPYASPQVLTTSGGTIKFPQTNITDPAAVAYVVPAGTIGNQAYNGTLGMDFDTLRPTTITSLGVFDSGADGIAGTLTVRLYDRMNTATPLTTLTFSAADQGTLIDGSRFKTLATPITLPAGFRGTIVAEGFTAADPNGNAPNPIPWTMNGGGGISFAGSTLNFANGRFGNAGAYPTNGDGGPANRYAAGTFGFVGGNYAGIDAANTTYPGVLNGAGGYNFFFTQGVGDVVLDQPGTGLQNTTIETRGGGGRLVVGGPATVAGATLSIGAPMWTGTNVTPPVSAYGIFAPGGNLQLTSPDGNPTTYTNPIRATASGTLIAGQAIVLAAR